MAGLLDSVQPSLRVDSELLPTFTLGVGGGAGGDGGASANGFVQGLLGLVKPSVTVQLAGQDTYTVAPFGAPSPGSLFPLLIAASLLPPLGLFAIGWWAGKKYGRST